jgi:phage baseplate assembly protein W
MSGTVLPTNPGSDVETYPTEFHFVRQPGFTYKLNVSQNKVVGYVDEREAYKQAVYKILNTERYEYVIYSWDYGVELKDLIGMPIYYVLPEIERRITEAVEQDDRTISVGNFSFDTSERGVVHVKFTATSIYGEEIIETDVNS